MDKESAFYRSIKVLTDLHLNTPQIMYSKWGEHHFTDNSARLKAMLQVTRGNRFVLPGSLTIYSRDSLSLQVLAMPDVPEIIFVAPKSVVMIEGTCRPSPYHNTIIIGDTATHLPWGIYPKMLPEGLRTAAMDLSNMLYSHRQALDGMEIKFTFHPKSEGTTGDRVLLWGIPIMRG